MSFHPGSEILVHYDGKMRHAGIIRYISRMDEYVVMVGGSEMFFAGTAVRKWNRVIR